MRLNGKDLKKFGLPHGPAFKAALDVFQNSDVDKDQIREIIQSIVKDPESYLDDACYGAIAAPLVKKKEAEPIALKGSACPFKTYGVEIIENGALTQMQMAARLPVSIKGALMPDAHQGYGLPVGGVIAVDNAVIPYAIGVDIGCRMKLTMYDIPASKIEGMKDRLKNILVDNTVFGAGQTINASVYDLVLDDARMDNIPFIKKNHLRELAISHLGTSGGGNHFVEFGSVFFPKISDEPKLAILSHSGSRGFGFKIANFYTKLAMEKCKLPKEARYLAWLDLDTEEGQEYWGAMNLAGEFAKACHDIIHLRLANALGEKEVCSIENHHNFAWKEQVDGKESIVHRKGSTPAGKGVLGIIPGSMTTNSYIVEGLGNEDSINSSSHGAGRAMSRAASKEKFTMNQMKEDLSLNGVELVGGSLDECSMAYKDIDAVMNYQKELVSILGIFQAKVVRMAEEDIKPWRDKKKKLKKQRIEENS